MGLIMTNDIYSIDSIVATRRGSLFTTFRGLKPTAKVIGPLRVPSLSTATDAFEASFSNTAAATAEHVEKAPKKKETPTP